jgi:hypothetical protein
MTSIARQTATPTNRSALPAIVRSIAWAGLALARRAHRSIREAAVTAQLGPDPETEVGRWTGARI